MLSHAKQTLACEIAISTEFSELFSLKRILKGNRNLTLVLKIALLQTLKIDWILIIKFDTSNISFTNLIHQTCEVSSAEPVSVNISIIVFMFSSIFFSVFEVMLSHNRVWLLSCINHSLAWMGHWQRKTPSSAHFSVRLGFRRRL